jgi:hypothetical protein
MRRWKLNSYHQKLMQHVVDLEKTLNSHHPSVNLKIQQKLGYKQWPNRFILKAFILDDEKLWFLWWKVFPNLGKKNGSQV